MEVESDLYVTQQALAILFLGSGILAIIVAVRAASFRQELTWRYLTYTMAAAAVWCISDAMFFVLAHNDAERWFWLVVGYSASIASSPLIFSMALGFAGLGHWLTRTVRTVLWAPFILSMLLALTNFWHGLIWDTTLSPLDLESGPGHGPYFFLLLPLAYGLPLAALFIFLHSCWRLRHIYRSQAIIVSVAVLLPITASMLYFTALNPVPGVDLAPAAFAASGVLALYGMKRLRFMELQPIYRDALFEQMRDGAAVIDAQDRLVDLNPAAMDFLAVDRRAIGAPAGDRLASRFVLADGDLDEGAHHIVATTDQPPRYYDLRVTGASSARIVVWRDTTRLRDALAVAHEQESLLAERTRANAIFTADIQRAVTRLKEQMREAVEQIDHGQLGMATVTLVQAESVTADQLLAEVNDVQAAASQEPDFLDAVRRYVGTFAESAGLDVTFTVTEPLHADDFAVDTRVQVVRVLQDALENVRQHAAASAIDIEFSQVAHEIALTIRDNGIGFDLAAAQASATGGGIEAMQHRALAAKGTLYITTEPQQGTCVQFLLPVQSTHVTKLKGKQVVIAHSNALVSDSMRALLVEQGMRIAAICHDYPALFKSMHTSSPEIFLLDVDLPGGEPAAIVAQIKHSCPDSRLVLLLGASSDTRLPTLLHNGADGCLVDTLRTTEFLDNLAQIAEGTYALQAGHAAQVLLEFKRQIDPGRPSWMTARQQEILSLLGEGLTYEEIGARLYLRERTVRYHVEQMRKRLGLANRSELVAYALRYGLTERGARRAR